MKSREELHKMLDVWWDDGLVGNLIIYRSPGAMLGDCIIERVLKCREMKPEIRAAFVMVMDELGVDRGEVFRNKNGDPDRIKLTRRLDGKSIST